MIYKRKSKFIAALLSLSMLFGMCAPSVKVSAEGPQGEWRTEKNRDGVEERYWYENGVKQGTTGRGKEIYDPESNAWYWLDAVQDGAVAKSKDVYMDSAAGVFADSPDGTGKWVRYDAQGRMVKGWRSSKYYDEAKGTVVEGVQYFDEYSGAMAKGCVAIGGKLYDFDMTTGYKTGETTLPEGFRMNGWNTINGVDYWFENGVKQGIYGRGKEIYDEQSGEWYWLDAVDGGRKAVSKDVYLDSFAGEWGDKKDAAGLKIGKWVRYDDQGHMVKGWCAGKGASAVKIDSPNKADGKDLYYFDPQYGTMVKGVVTIGERKYKFDERTGICQGDISLKPVLLVSNKDAYEYYYGQWSNPIKSYLVQVDANNMMRLQAGGTDNAIWAEYYTTDYGLRAQRRIPMELPIFGGFYSTASNYYLVTGQSNKNESDQVEVIRVTKYDKSWKRLGSAGIYGASTAVPFDAGSLRIAECGNYLLVRTCHKTYANLTDGVNNQANLTFAVDTENMTVTDMVAGLQNISSGFVSHSFNQFIKVEDNDIISLDHGDAYPRAAVLLKYHVNVSDGKFTDELAKVPKIMEQVNVLNFPGEIGVNRTGAGLGGFEISDSSYLVAGSSVIQDDRNLTRTAKNVFVAAVDKNSKQVNTQWVTGYEEGKGSASNPHFVRITRNEYLLLWTKFGGDGENAENSGENGENNGENTESNSENSESKTESKVYYTKVNGSGGHGAICEMEGSLSDCVPLCVNGRVVWYVSDSDGVSFYEINLGDMKGRLAKKVQ